MFDLDSECKLNIVVQLTKDSFFVTALLFYSISAALHISFISISVSFPIFERTALELSWETPQTRNNFIQTMLMFHLSKICFGTKMLFNNKTFAGYCNRWLRIYIGLTIIPQTTSSICAIKSSKRNITYKVLKCSSELKKNPWNINRKYFKV